MKLAFCLFKYFPYGGLQRDFYAIAHACRARGHEIHVYTLQWTGAQPDDWHIHLIATSKRQNHLKNQDFAKSVSHRLLTDCPDLVIGFNKMPGLDIYYAADVCYKARARDARGWWYRLLPRYRQLVSLENAVFAHGMNTKILLIAPAQQAIFQHHYQTEGERFHVLPPGIARDRQASADAAQIRANLRKRYALSEQDILLLMVGSGFKTKGLDRALHALAALPATLQARIQFFVIGEDNPRIFIKLAKQLKLEKKLRFLGGRHDVPDFLQGADLLIHPAYHENAGMILLEAVVAGLPVLTVEACGYAHYIQQANAGVVLPSPFQQEALNFALENMLSSPQYPLWKENGLAFGKTADIYSLPEKAVNFIETIGEQRVSR